jgi:hypothetical protein
MDGYAEARWFTGSQERAAAWREHGAEILATWMVAYAGTRPWAWWVHDATEARRCVDGVELLVPPIDRMWRQGLGIPAFVQCRPRGVGLPTVEAQAAYLRRLGLLSADEGAGLAADAFTPETVDPFVLTEEEVARLFPYRETDE